MKIVFVMDNLDAGGAERVVANLANCFVENNKVSIILTSSPTKELFYNLSKNIKIKFIQAEFNNKISIFKKIIILRRKIKEVNPDVLISFLPHVNIFTYIANIGLKIPHIVSERNNPMIDPSNKYFRKIKEFVFKRSDGVVYQTNDAKNYYKKYNIQNEVIIKNPITHKDIKRESVKKTIINVGRLTKQKNQKLLIDAFDKFYKSHKDYSLKIYGQGELENELKDYANSMGSGSNIQFMGASQTWIAESINATMFVLSSDYEGMPNTLIEAMSVGIPSIATDCPIGGSKEVVKNGKNGFLVTVGSAEELSTRMIELADNKQLQEQFSNESKKIIKELDINVIALQWLDFIKLVIENKRRDK